MKPICIHVKQFAYMNLVPWPAVETPISLFTTRGLGHFAGVSLYDNLCPNLVRNLLPELLLLSI